MDLKLKTIINNSTLFSEEMKQRLMAVGDKLTEEQLNKVIASVQEAETKKETILTDQKVKEDETNQRAYDEAKRITREAPKKAMKAAEEVEHKQEEAKLDGILSELDNL